ncbi:sulfatase [Haladaptatus sp. R4]|uniref:sulfatase family protein n=1 Tax=Haladaptatus sp. R4 TaxID=1679489 RepID=UPI0007B46216|nr:sulfatase-like hydrolase/transferase [Haladaptatus sp. R4]KZN22602.1 sulfatase [Haladaptatus sp. R4]
MTHPNILWICTDQQRFDTLGCYGNEFVDTPNIDQLSNDGVRFDRCYCQSPVCTPSRASFLTGRYPRTNGVRQNGQSIPTEETLVTAQLADNGYTCGLSGKLHISNCNPEKEEERPMMERRIDDGYAQFHWSHDTQRHWPTNEYYQWLASRNVEFERTPVRDSEYVTTSVPAQHHQTTWCTEKGVEFVEANEDFDEPWLFSVNMFDPHHPFDPPQEYLERYLDRLDEIPLPNYESGELDDKPVFQRQDHRHAYNTPGLFPFPEMDDNDHRLLRAAYWAMCDLIDDQVGQLLDALERTDQREDTIVIFTSDHGELLGDHGIYLKGPYFYEPSVRVPLIISWPTELPTGIETNALVELSDLAPTLLEAAGEEPHPGMQAESLWPRLYGDEPLERHRESVLSELHIDERRASLSLDADDELENEAIAQATMLRTDRYKLVHVRGDGVGELYDLTEDPVERNNRWNDPAYADVKRELLNRLVNRLSGAVDPLPQRKAPW